MSPVFLLVPLMALVPLVPAFVLFKFLKSTATTTSEEFYGFRIQLGGAFAAYFVVMMFLLYFFKPYLTPPVGQVVYKLQGQVVDENSQGVPVTANNFAVLPQQPMVQPDPNGNFVVYLLVDPDNGNFKSFPKISVSYRDFLPVNLTLDPNDPGYNPSELKRDEVHHVIYASAIKLSRPNKEDVHSSIPQPIQAPAAHFGPNGNVLVTTAPPGYARNSNPAPNQ